MESAMTNWPGTWIRARGPALLAGCALIVGACAATGAVPSAPTETPLAIPSPMPLPAEWLYQSWTDPDLEIGLPADWHTTNPGASASASAAPASAAPASGAPAISGGSVASGPPVSALRYGEWAKQLIAAGAVRLLGTGRVISGAMWLDGGSIRVTVTSGDPTLGAFASRQESELGDLLQVDIERTVLAVPLGVAVRLSYRGWLDVETTFAGRDYLMRLPDGRSLDIAIDMPDAVSDAAADGFAATVLSTLRPSS
jgi:hypothetical protein